mmetsp:Transcript_17159/g.24145  ORF Transcript_17159/g.24145 Transcript_17159/m.24145 type:complete len:401 (-) Transcript_17159:24-1226(-)
MSWIGSLLSLPSQVFFFAIWVITSLVRPVSQVCLVLLILNPFAAMRKIQLFITTAQYLVMCNDKKWKAPHEDPASFFETSPKDKTEKKTIIFVRHGESTWNDTFNKGDRSTMSFVLNFIPNLIWSIFVEVYLFVGGYDNESWFYDSPLSQKGLSQAHGVRNFLQQPLEFSTPREQELIRIMLGIEKVKTPSLSPEGGEEESSSSEEEKSSKANGNNSKAQDTPSSQLVSSNLRRAISTMAIGFQDRLEQKMPNDSILILTQLQEISRNPDALSITPPKGTVLDSWTDRHLVHDILTNQCDTSLHTGNKPINSNGLIRMQEFCSVVFDKIEKDHVIVAGHSLWFRSFFRTFLPHTVDHVSKKKKLVNGGCVGFTLERIETSKGNYKYLIDPRGITVLYGGF